MSVDSISQSTCLALSIMNSEPLYFMVCIDSGAGSTKPEFPKMNEWIGTFLLVLFLFLRFQKKSFWSTMLSQPDQHCEPVHNYLLSGVAKKSTLLLWRVLPSAESIIFV
jgi:hypothetical protein